MKDQIQAQLNQLKTQTGVDFVGLATSKLTERGIREIRWQFVSGNLSEQYKKIVLQPGKGLAGIVWRTGRKLVDEHLQAKKENFLSYPILTMERLESAVALPVLHEQEVIAVLLLAYREEKEIAQEIIQQAESLTEKLTSSLAGTFYNIAVSSLRATE